MKKINILLIVVIYALTSYAEIITMTPPSKTTKEESVRDILTLENAKDVYGEHVFYYADSCEFLYTTIQQQLCNICAHNYHCYEYIMQFYQQNNYKINPQIFSWAFNLLEKDTSISMFADMTLGELYLHGIYVSKDTTQFQKHFLPHVKDWNTMDSIQQLELQQRYYSRRKDYHPLKHLVMDSLEITSCSTHLADSVYNNKEACTKRIMECGDAIAYSRYINSFYDSNAYFYSLIMAKVFNSSTAKEVCYEIIKETYTIHNVEMPDIIKNWLDTFL